MKASSLEGKAVVDLSIADKIGSVSQVVIDPNARKVLALEIRGERFSAPQIVLIEKVRSFGKDAVTIDNSSGLNERANVSELGGLPNASDFIGTRVVTESGTLLGTVRDVLFSDDGKEIVGYEYSRGGIGALVGLGHKTLSASSGQRYGGTILTVPDAEAAQPERSEES